MILFHGSIVAVETPKILKSERFLDFGAGFYTTTSRDRARRRAMQVADRQGARKWTISTYAFDVAAAERELTIIRFLEPNEAWLKFVCACRRGRKPAGPYDVVIGPVANDSAYKVVRLYETGDYDANQAIERLRFRRPYDQVLFHTEKALQSCRYIGHQTEGQRDDKEEI